METTIETINLTGNEICDMISGKKEKIVKVRTEKQKENDIKLKSKLTEYHKKRKELKAIQLKENEINKELQLNEIDINECLSINDSAIFINVEEQEKEIEEINKYLSVNNSDDVKAIKIKKGRPSKKNKEILLHPGPLNESISISV